MIKTLTYLIFINSLCCFNWWPSYSTCVYTNNVLYVYDTNRNDTKSHGISKYSLKDGPITELKPEYFNLQDGLVGNSPAFINIPDDIRKSIPQGDKAWMLLFSNGSYSQSGDVFYPNGGLRYVSDEERVTKFDVKLEDPRNNNMTQSAYAVTGIREGDSYSVYVSGGITTKPGYKHTVITNGFQKYDFKANKWTDFGKKVVNDITSAFHKAVNVDDKMIYYLGGVYVYSDYVELPVMETNYTMFYSTFENIKIYNLAKKDWESIQTSVFGSVPFDLKSGRYGFSAAYSNRKIYVYGGIISKNDPNGKGALVEEEYVSDYLGVLDIDNNHIWEWYQPKEPKGEKSSRKLAFHDSIIYKNQLILTHGGIADDKNKYKVHAIDLDTKDFSDYIGPSPNVKSDDGNSSSGLPSYAIAIIVVAIIVVILIIGYLVYRKRRRSKSKKNNSTQSLQEVWATPQNVIVNTKSGDNTSTGLTENTVTNKNPLDSDFEDGGNHPEPSKTTQLYMDLPYFQHEVDTHDTQIDYLAKDQQNQITK